MTESNLVLLTRLLGFVEFNADISVFVETKEISMKFHEKFPVSGDICYHYVSVIIRIRSQAVYVCICVRVCDIKIYVCLLRQWFREIKLFQLKNSLNVCK